MVAKGQDTNVQCQFCGRAFKGTLDELKAMLEQANPFPTPVGWARTKTNIRVRKNIAVIIEADYNRGTGANPPESFRKFR